MLSDSREEEVHFESPLFPLNNEHAHKNDEGYVESDDDDQFSMMSSIGPSSSSALGILLDGKVNTFISKVGLLPLSLLVSRAALTWSRSSGTS